MEAAAPHPAHEDHESGDEGDDVQVDDIARKGDKVKGKPGRKRAKLDEDPNRPKPPHTGYVRFLLEQRDEVSRANPHLPLPEVTKAVALRWRAASSEQKQPYLDAAEADKKRYSDEMTAYYANFPAAQRPRAALPVHGPATAPTTPGVVAGPAPMEARSSAKRRSMPASIDGALLQDPNIDTVEMLCRPCQQFFSNTHNMREHLHGRKHRLLTGQIVEEEETVPDIPIFTEEFIRHNRLREEEVRELRRANTQYDEQNRALGATNTKLRETVSRLEEDGARTAEECTAMRTELASLQEIVLTAFAELPLPGIGPSGSADEYLAHLVSMFQNGLQDSGFTQRVRNVLQKTQTGAPS